MAIHAATVSTENNGGPLLVTSIVLLSLTWLCLLLRLYARAFIARTLLLDDWLMLVGQVIFTLSCAFILRGCYHGIGRHGKSLERNDEIQALMYQALCAATYIIDTMFIKLSIAVLLLRLATHNIYRCIIWASIAVITCWSLALFFWDIFQCKPVSAQWDYTLATPAKSACVSSQQAVHAAYALSAMTVFTDWLYVLLPIPMVCQSDMTKQAKASLVFVLGLGAFASVATVMRLTLLSTLTDGRDLLYASTDAMTWTVVEPGVGIIASCLVTLGPILQRCNVRGFGGSENAKSDGASGDEASAGAGASKTFGGWSMPGFGFQDRMGAPDLESGGKDESMLQKELGGAPAPAFAGGGGGRSSLRLSSGSGFKLTRITEAARAAGLTQRFDFEEPPRKFSDASGNGSARRSSRPGSQPPTTTKQQQNNGMEVRTSIAAYSVTAPGEPSPSPSGHYSWFSQESPTSDGDLELHGLEPVYFQSGLGTPYRRNKETGC